MFGITPGTLLNEVARTKRHNARHNNRKLRKDATEQLRLLRWLYHEEVHILEHGDELKRKAVAERGVPTNPKRFYDTPDLSGQQRATHSRALRRLEEQGLISRDGNRRTRQYMHLTPAGRAEARTRTEQDRYESFLRLHDSGEAERMFTDAGLPYPPVFIRAREAESLSKRFQALRLALRQLCGLFKKWASGSPALSRLTNLLKETEAAGDTYVGDLMHIGTHESSSADGARAEVAAEEFQEVLTRLESELQSLLNANHS